MKRYARRAEERSSPLKKAILRIIAGKNFLPANNAKGREKILFLFFFDFAYFAGKNFIHLTLKFLI